MWEKENQENPLYCYELETTERYVFLMAQSVMKAIQYFEKEIKYIDELEEIKEELLNIKQVTDEKEFRAKMFFIGERGTAMFEEGWVSLDDLILREKQRFQRKHFGWEQQTETYYLGSVPFKRTYEEYKESMIQLNGEFNDLLKEIDQIAIKKEFNGLLLEDVDQINIKLSFKKD